MKIREDRYFYHRPHLASSNSTPTGLILAHISRATREKFLIWSIRSRPINVNLEHLEPFLSTSFPVADVSESIVENYRVCLRISVLSNYRTIPKKGFFRQCLADLVPLIKLLTASPKVEVSFVTSCSGHAALPTDTPEAQTANELNDLIARPDVQQWANSTPVRRCISNYLVAPNS
jgi:hypothetical protein